MHTIRKLVVFLLLWSQFLCLHAYAEGSQTQQPPGTGILMMLNSNVTVVQNVYHDYRFGLFNEQDHGMAPFLEKDSTMVPLRFLAEQFGAKVRYESAQAIHVDWKGQTFTFALDSPVVQVNQEEITMPAAAELLNNSTYVPLRIISEAVGERVLFDNGALYIGDSTNDSDASLQQQLEQYLPALKKGMPYLVYQGDNFLDGYVSREQAIAYAKRWNNSSVKTRDGDAVWDYSMMKSVFLTFDDGPNANTSAILDLLQSYGIHATFFMLGPHIDRYPELVQRMVKEGHSVGLHGVTHNYKLIYRSPQTVLDEMSSCEDSLQKAAGVTTDLIRMPYGSKPYMKQAYRDAVVGAGYKMWDWNIDSTDSLGADTDTIISTTIKQVASRDRDRTVILFHDKDTTLQALPTVIEYLISHDFAFRTIGQDMAPTNFWGDTR